MGALAPLPAILQVALDDIVRAFDDQVSAPFHARLPDRLVRGDVDGLLRCTRQGTNLLIGTAIPTNFQRFGNDRKITMFRGCPTLEGEYR